MKNHSSRRNSIKTIVAAATGVVLSPVGSLAACSQPGGQLQLKGNINHSVCRWTYGHLKLDELCVLANEIGIKAIDLVGPKEWEVLKRYGLDSSMCNGAEINLVNGFNDPQYHSTLVKNYSEMIPLVSKAGYKNLICFSGNRNGMDDETGLTNCVKGLQQVLPLAEKHGVVLHMELLNSKVDHKDYMCDKSTWGVELCKRLGSANFKLLYDIYHMQIDEGDVIRTIRANHQYYGHYHTAGVPGRNEIDDQQELYYPAIMRAIIATGFKGYVAQEFIPKGADKRASLRKAIETCDV
ncbi:TIM barrel protein [Flavihumibacter rivuli]|uniref:hydroxypyruvate isomerase family protein n=1 Tax=Flavihumibacter rivuli TaxID=2838156 RepID=UPI001BDDF6B9|nr:TIM barrel protein [Flavihumibacter rivuli]ULQ58052.1 TIM barrel protein [Flavihumibacter rivuli]